MSMLILGLALQAMHDPDALPAFGDAIQLMGWKDGRERGFAVDKPIPSGWTTREHFPMLSGHKNISVAISDEATPTKEYARAVAAVLLFAGWPTRWELAERCEVVDFWEAWHLAANDDDDAREVRTGVLYTPPPVQWVRYRF